MKLSYFTITGDWRVDKTLHFIDWMIVTQVWQVSFFCVIMPRNSCGCCKRKSRNSSKKRFQSETTLQDSTTKSMLFDSK